MLKALIRSEGTSADQGFTRICNCGSEARGSPDYLSGIEQRPLSSRYDFRRLFFSSWAVLFCDTTRQMVPPVSSTM